MLRKKPIDAEAAKRAIQNYWGSRGDDGLSEAAEECRKLSAEQLRLVEAWIPDANPGSSTAVKCDRARRMVAGVIAEKA